MRSTRGTRRRGVEGRHQSGVTLIELMVVVAVVGLLVGLAAVALKPSGYARTARGFADRIVAEIETMRLRATSTNRWQRLEVFSDGVILYQSTGTGMAEPAAGDWEETGQIVPPSDVEIYAHDTQTRAADGDPIPSAGVGLDAGTDPIFPDNTIDLYPDGSMRQPATLYVQDENGDNQVRVVTYRATGIAYLINSW